MTDREALAALLHAEFITHEMGKGSADDRCGLCEQRAEHLIAAGVTLAPSLDEGLWRALRKYGEHQHEWAAYPTQRFDNGAWRDAVEPEEGWDRKAVVRLCPDETTRECWCGLEAALQEGETTP